jgi:VPDSG-CTERM motif
MDFGGTADAACEFHMKLGTSFLVGVAGLLLASQAHALVYMDFEQFDSTTGHVGLFQPLSGSFNIATSDGGDGIFGYNPSLEHVVSAYAEFTIIDDTDIFDRPETFIVELSSRLFLAGSATLFIGTEDVKGIALFDLSADGILNYKVTSLGGDFQVESALLVATTEPGGVRNVPDGGGTAMLLGTSLLGLLALRQKFATASVS